MVVVTFSIFNKKLLSLVKLFHKSKYQLKLKLGTYTYLNMHHSIVVYIFLYFRLEISFLGKFGPKKSKLSF